MISYDMCEVFEEPPRQGSSSKSAGDNCSIWKDCISKWPFGKPEQKGKAKLSHALSSLFLTLKCCNCLNSSGIKARWLTSCREIACIIYMAPWASRGVVICVDRLTNDIQIDCLRNDFWLLRQFTSSYSFPLIVRCRSKNRELNVKSILWKKIYTSAWIIVYINGQKFLPTY